MRFFCSTQSAPALSLSFCYMNVSFSLSCSTLILKSRVTTWAENSSGNRRKIFTHKYYLNYTPTHHIPPCVIASFIFLSLISRFIQCQLTPPHSVRENNMKTYHFSHSCRHLPHIYHIQMGEIEKWGKKATVAKKNWSTFLVFSRQKIYKWI